MKNICTVNLTGRLTKQPEIKATTTGATILEFSIAWNTSKKTQDGYEDESNFIDCVVFGHRAEALSRYLQKGMKVSLQGTLKQNKWQTKDGENRFKHIIVIDELELPAREKQASQPPIDQAVYDEPLPFQS